MKFQKKVVGSLAVLSLLAACGQVKDSLDEQEATPPQEQVAADGSNIDGFYLARFETLNGHIVGSLPGSASFTRKEDRLFVYLRLFAGSPKAWHMQAVYTGSRCPTLSDDTNGDGFIDMPEALAVVGDVLIPLDSDPGSQSSGRAFYPLGDLSGSYHYERIVNFSRFLGDLQKEDTNLEDNITKLGPGQGLSFIGKVIMVQGVGEEKEIPETVGTYGRHKPFQTLPIACGIYQKESVAPGIPYDEIIPGPVANVEEGQDRPAPDDQPGETTGGTGGTTSGGSNDSDDGNGPVSDGNSGTTGGGSGTTSSTSSSSTGSSSTGGSSSTSSSTTGGTSGTTGGGASSSSSSTSTTTTTGGSSSSSSSSVTLTSSSSSGSTGGRPGF